jgi:TRAP-type C4-dicarboxylate transport system permease small subunit
MTIVEHYIGIVLRSLAVALLVGISLLMIANVINRFLPFGSLDWNDEIIELMLVWLIFTGSAEVWRINQHFAVDVVPVMLEGSRYEKPWRVFLLIGCLVFISIFTYRSFDLFQRAVDVSPYFSLPRGLWYAAMPVNGFLMALFSLRRLGALISQSAKESRPPGSEALAP